MAEASSQALVVSPRVSRVVKVGINADASAPPAIRLIKDVRQAVGGVESLVFHPGAEGPGDEDGGKQAEHLPEEDGEHHRTGGAGDLSVLSWSGVCGGFHIQDYNPTGYCDLLQPNIEQSLIDSYTCL